MGFRAWSMIASVAALLVSGCSGDKDERPRGDAVAGEVVELTGSARAESPAGASRDLAVGAAIRAHDTIVTGPASALVIAFQHNGARWSLGAERRVAVASSAAFQATAGAGSALAGGEPDDVTSAAGRHAENQSADTRGSAPADPAPAAAAPQVEREAMAEAMEAEPAASAEEAPGGPPPGADRDAPQQKERVSRRPAPRRGAREEPAASADDSIGLLGDSSKAGAGAGAATRDSAASKAAVAMGELRVEGAHEAAKVTRGLRRQLPRLRFCYQRALRETPTLRGRGTLSLVIAADGRVRTAALEGIASERMRSCTRQAFTSIRFGEAAGETRVAVPVTLGESK